MGQAQGSRKGDENGGDIKRETGSGGLKEEY